MTNSTILRRESTFLHQSMEDLNVPSKRWKIRLVNSNSKKTTIKREQMSMARRTRMLMDKLTMTRMVTPSRPTEIRITMVRKTTVRMMALRITELVNLFKLTKFKIFSLLKSDVNNRLVNHCSTRHQFTHYITAWPGFQYTLSRVHFWTRCIQLQTYSWRA